MKRKTQGFTLIELLIVIAIMGVLAGSIIGTMGKSLKSARMASDLNNFKQVGMGLDLYAEDHNGQVPSSISDLHPSYIDNQKVFALADGTPITLWQGTPGSFLPGGMEGLPSENIIAIPSKKTGDPSEITLADANWETYYPHLPVLLGDLRAKAVTEEDLAGVGFHQPPPDGDVEEPLD